MSGSRQVGRAEHARRPGVLLRRQPAGGAAARVRAQRRRATTARRKQRSRSASTCATAAPIWRTSPTGCRSSARPALQVRTWCSSTAATKCCSSAMPTPAAAIRWPPGPGAGRRDLARTPGAHAAAPIAERVIDTSELNVHQLRRLVDHRVRARRPSGAVVAVRVVRLQARRAAGRGLRVRCALPAESALAPAPAPAVGPRRAGARFPGSAARRRRVLRRRPRSSSIPGCRASSGHRSYVTVAFGCTGGRHRSVYLAERLPRTIAIAAKACSPSTASSNDDHRQRTTSSQAAGHERRRPADDPRGRRQGADLGRAPRDAPLPLQVAAVEVPPRGRPRRDAHADRAPRARLDAARAC